MLKVLVKPIYFQTVFNNIKNCIAWLRKQTCILK